ncbi:hypothetical protein Salat_0905800 [Sesamum alatum]|uniref:Uncharacterized protein n=1 Tax=Sesamum alatum TaxID=300844 RepID=A0AAE1YJZ6_9LAMI|nr:hypothetical protein Salat_0905800 [Sesamum alatum]
MTTLIRWFSNFSSTILRSIRLRGNNMAGPIFNVFENMISLEYLDLTRTDIQGGILKYFGNLSSLTSLYMSGNNLASDLSEMMMNISAGPVAKKLENLILGRNYFSGLLPNMSRFSSLYVLDLSVILCLSDSFRPYSNLKAVTLDISRNKISGSIEFLCYVKEWMLIDLSDNLFSGRIPDCFANFKLLRYLNLANNQFSGEIPYSFGLLSGLTLLHLRNNSFSGGLPTSMRNCTSLEMIDVGDNRLTGKIPDWIGDSFPELIVLIIRSNVFYGSMSSSICHLAKLQILDISSNKIDGVMPECLQNFIGMTTDLNPNPFSNS